jgi:serine/threonine-protein kinase
MSLSLGTRLGPYEVTAQIGAGGMGEVYRARDSRLQRDVAIKVLPETFAQDRERLARFEREARTLASLNHPNIAAIYELEDADGVKALVMELVEGPTLADRIAQGAIPVGEALPIAKQIAEALEAAHQQGIIHRDLKPANVKVRPDGAVKVLDFGLAKLTDVASVTRSVEETASPTITSPAMLTGLGMILGTAAYMSPEQAKGRQADQRSDVWAFGCVLFEMLSGSRAFGDDDVFVTLSKVLQVQPDFDALPSDLSPVVRRFLERCLQKDPRRRVHDIADVRLALEGAFDLPVTSVEPHVVPATMGSTRRVLHFAIAALLGGAAAAVLVRISAPPSLLPVSLMEVPTSASSAVSIDGTERDVSVTPDGTRIVYAGNNGTQIFVRSLDQLEPTPLVTASGTVRGVFTSPDGEWVGFVEGTNTLRKVASTGGPPITLLPMDGNSLGAAWESEAAIVFATANPATGLQRVSAEGGTAEVLTMPDRKAGHAGSRVARDPA